MSNSFVGVYNGFSGHSLSVWIKKSFGIISIRKIFLASRNSGLLYFTLHATHDRAFKSDCPPSSQPIAILFLPWRKNRIFISLHSRRALQPSSTLERCFGMVRSSNTILGSEFIHAQSRAAKDLFVSAHPNIINTYSLASLRSALLQVNYQVLWNCH